MPVHISNPRGGGATFSFDPDTSVERVEVYPGRAYRDYRTADQFIAERVGAAGDAGYYANREHLRRHPLKVSERYRALQEAGRYRGGRNGYD